MEILGIGPLELFFIIIIALLVLGPKDMVKAGKSIGRFLRKLVTSSSWRTIQQTSRDLKHLPNKLMNEAGLDELEKEMGLKDIENDIGLKEINKNISDISKDIKKDISDWTTPSKMSFGDSSVKQNSTGDKKIPGNASENISDNTGITSGKLTDSTPSETPPIPENLSDSNSPDQ